MTDRRRLSQVRDLALLRRAERDAAGGDVAEARTREQGAIADAKAAADRVGALAARWYDANAGGALDPDTSAAIGRMLIHAEAGARVQADAAAKATRRHDAEIERWRGLDAHVRAADQVARNLARRVARADDEASLAATADRVTAGWKR